MNRSTDSIGLVLADCSDTPKQLLPIGFKDPIENRSSIHPLHIMTSIVFRGDATCKGGVVWCGR